MDLKLIGVICKNPSNGQIDVVLCRIANEVLEHECNCFGDNEYARHMITNAGYLSPVAFITGDSEESINRKLRQLDSPLEINQHTNQIVIDSFTVVTHA